MSDTFIVIGGDAAGMSAASKAKREQPGMDVVVFEKGEWVSYAACGMPYYVKGDVAELDDLVAVTPEEFRDTRGVDLRTDHEVVDIDPGKGVVVVGTGDRRFERSYDSLLVATGASAIEPPFDGTGLDGVFTIHDLDEADAIEAYVTDRGPETAAVVGVGGEPNVRVASDAGIELGPTGAVATDEYGRTNYENVYAAGDCAEAHHVLTGDPDHVPLALTANRDTGRLLGGSVVGREGVKRVDTVATALHAGMTVSELRNADLAYAPPFSPVWDPVLTAAKVLGGRLE